MFNQFCFSRILARKSPEPLVLIARRVRKLPTPGALDDCFDIFEQRLPAERVPRSFGGSNQSGRIACTPRSFYCRNRMPGDFAACVDYFTNGSAAPCTKVVKPTPVRRKRQNMGRRQILNVDIISDACSVRRRKICSVYLGVR